MNKSKLFSLALIALFLLGISLSAFAAETNDSELTYAVEASASTVKGGDEITVTVSLAENPGFKWAMTELVFDANVLTYKSYSVAGSIYENLHDSNPNTSKFYIGTRYVSDGEQSRVQCTLGDLFAALGNGSTDFVKTGKLFSVTFTVAEDYSGSIEIEAGMSNPEGQLLDLNNKSGVITVNNASCVVYVTETGHVHTPVEIPGKEASCTEAGYTAGSKCSECGEILQATTAIPAKGHTEEILPAKDPTCTETGLTEGKKCSVCGEITVAQEEIPATGHDEYSFRENFLDPTCGADGSYDFVVCCKVCEAEISRRTVVQPATGEHTEVIDSAVAATCTESGLTEGKHCSVCNTVIIEQEEIPALGHDYKDGFCTRCEEKEPTGTYLLGDVNMDGNVNSSDLSLLFRYVSMDTSLKAFTAEQLALSDVNQDGIVNSSDVNILFRYVSRDTNLAWKPKEITI